MISQPRACTLYPFSFEGAVISKGMDPGVVSQTFHSALVTELAKFGITALVPVAGSIDQDVVIHGRVVKADGGSRWMRYLFTFFAGAAEMEVEGAVGTKTAPIAQLHAKGTRRAGAGGGNSASLLNDAARMAGERLAKQVAASLGVAPAGK